tara:strand:+ start:286 stop:867 length:582 start_codon:yes stop_codon:yes gene_type:complete
MPKFKENPSPFMAGYSYPGTSPVKDKTVTINEDGSKTVTKTRKDGTVKKVKEFKAGKKRAYKTTKTRKSGKTVTREWEKGVKGPTITKTDAEGNVTSQTTRKQRQTKRKKIVKGAKSFINTAARVGAFSTIMGGGALTALTKFPKTSGLILGGTIPTTAGILGESVIQGIKNVGSNIKSNIQRKRKNPNRKRL